MITKRLIFMLAAGLPSLPRVTWLPIIGIARKTNNFLFNIEQTVRMASAMGFTKNPAAMVFGWTNYPNGIASHGAPVIDTGLFSPFGDVYFTDSGHGNKSDNNAGTRPTAPTATINGAYDKATASQGDVVLVAAGHAETVASATTLAMDTVGVKVVGLGRGADRPTLTFSATGSNIPVSAASNVLSNFLLTITGTVDVVAGITVSAAGVHLDRIEQREPAATSQWTDAIVGTTCDQLEISNYKFAGLVAGDATQAAISVTGTPAEIHLHNLFIVGEFVAGGIDISGVATDIHVEDITIEQRHSSTDACVTVAATTTGFLKNCYLRSATNDDSGLTAIVTAGNDLQMYNVHMVNANGEHAATGEVSDLDVTNTRSGKTFSTIA